MPPKTVLVNRRVNGKNVAIRLNRDGTGVGSRNLPVVPEPVEAPEELKTIDQPPDCGDSDDNGDHGNQTLSEVKKRRLFEEIEKLSFHSGKNKGKLPFVRKNQIVPELK